MDRPRAPAPDAAARFQALSLLTMASADPVNDAMAERERLRLEAEAQTRRQGVLWLRPVT